MAVTLLSSEGRREPALTARDTVRAQVVAGALSGGLVLGLAEANGGYYPLAWGRTALIVLGVTAVSLVLARTGPRSRSEWGLLAAFAGFLGWCAIEALRPGAATAAVPELERGGLYLIVLWAAFILLRRETTAAALAGVLAATVVLAFQELVQYLLEPPPINAFEGRLLFEPLGYANATGVLAAMGAALALGVALHGGTVVYTTLSAASLVPLLSVVYLSQSRGAALALAGGALVLVVSTAKPRVALSRLGVALLLPLVGVCVCALARFGDVQHEVAPATRATVASVLALLTAASVPVAWFTLRDRPAGEPQGSRRSVPQRRFLIAAAIASGAAIGIAFHPLLGDRSAYWAVAWSDFLHHPLLGAGPGSFGEVWLRHRPTMVSTNDAHSLYLETLDETGPVGLAFLIVALFIPLAVARRSMRPSSASTALTAYIVFLLHAAIDWDWEMPAVTVTALVLAAVVMVASRDPAVEAAPCARRATAAMATATAVAVIAFVAIQAGNSALSAAARSAQAGEWAATENHAQTAMRWQPWSAEPYLLLGQAQASTGQVIAARRTFRNAARRAPTDWRPWFDLAAVTHGQTRAAAIKRVLELDPLGATRRSR